MSADAFLVAFNQNRNSRYSRQSIIGNHAIFRIRIIKNKAVLSTIAGTLCNKVIEQVI
jgi:hypothetical protein